MFSTINRNVVLIAPKKKLIDWVSSVCHEPLTSFEEPFSDDNATVYLIPEKMNTEKCLRYLQKNFLPIFKQELFNWCTDDELWPNPLTWELFLEWFYISVQSMILDIANEPIIVEEDI